MHRKYLLAGSICISVLGEQSLISNLSNQLPRLVDSSWYAKSIAITHIIPSHWINLQYHKIIIDGWLGGRDDFWKVDIP